MMKFFERFKIQRKPKVVIQTLERGWNDRSEMMPHAMFQILTDFVEKEKPFDHFDWENSHNKQAWEAIQYLYKWWHEEYLPFDPYKNIEIPEEEPKFNLKFKTEITNAYEAENSMELKLKENCKKLVDLMGHLWT